ncbi:MauE/DoxX family redox-associated membrane protein [Flavobacterium sp. JAS]|uniref:MauE/DoxX family redox-associated membrane protein n=1 Tax=Flavobacterium sp. JAS TaxID=2897329 RepID=UPI001E470EC7|nr:MauE/DoxX family redox-associated membrane protein [Flavobacterium sp. JAS]MCD0472544.1 hypothetical protein [Flavobacterium sp. JAS]
MKLKNSFKSIFIEAVSLLYVLLFVYAASSKLMDFENFQVQIGQSPLLSVFASWVSWLVPLIELLLSAALIIPRFRYFGLLGALSLMSMFIAYIFIILHFSSFVPCSCGGILEKMSWNTHLIFNIVFLLLAILAILWEDKNITGKKVLPKFFTPIKTILFLMGCSIFTMVLLFLFSERIMHHENPFIRRYPQHPVMLQKAINLQFNSYYFAGNTNNRIYLANYTDPLHITVFDTTLRRKEVFKITFDPKDIPFKRIKIIVRGSYFYLMDGTVPCIFWGRTTNWKITNQIKGCHYFTIAEPVDSSAVLFRSNNGKNAAHIFSSYKALRTPKIIYNASLLQQQLDGVFDTDGMLAYNEKMKQMVYLYYYRNEYTVADANAKLIARGHTIDTISHAQIKVVYLKDKTERKMAAPPLIVNANLTVYKNLLFVNSKIQGRFEDQKLWKQAQIIDVYDLSKNTYVLSFALYNIENKKLQSFKVTDTHLYALIGDELAVYELRDIIKKEIKMRQ